MKARISKFAVATLTLFSLSALGAEIHTGWWRGRQVTYKVVNGRAIWQRDALEIGQRRGSAGLWRDRHGLDRLRGSVHCRPVLSGL